jgi:oxygen-dependent protoporphyrinogen oxidase
MKPHIVIIGGGISGLSAAHRLAALKKTQRFPLDITVLEASDRLGGVIKSEKKNDYIIEHGPDSLIDQASALSLCQELGLADQLVPTDHRYRRAFIAFKGKLHAIPKGFAMIAPADFISFATSSLFTVPGKLRALMDLILPKRSDNDKEETAADFIKRRLGKEVFDRAAQALVGGIYMADLNQLSAKGAIGRFVEMESKHGSIIRGLLQEDRKHLATASGARYSKFMTLRDGMQGLIDALVNSLTEEHIMLWSQAVSVNYLANKGWQIKLATNDTLRADGVILALPAFQAARLLSGLDTALSDKLTQIENTSSAVVNLLFRRKDIGHSLNGFGFVVPSIENRQILACAFISIKFPKRAAKDNVMLRVFIGGSFMPEHKNLHDDQLKAIALAELSPLLQLQGKPLESWVARYPNSMPHYKVGHLDLIKSIRASVNQWKGLELAGNSYSGIGIPDCIASGERAAESLLESLQNHACARV